MTKRLKGLNQHRFKGNPEEKRFAEAWAAQGPKHLGYLLDNGEWTPLTPSDHDEAIAATVIQWLGSPVGQIMLCDLGYTNILLSRKDK